jgi:hypothetical protein
MSACEPLCWIFYVVCSLVELTLVGNLVCCLLVVKLARVVELIL